MEQFLQQIGDIKKEVSSFAAADVKTVEEFRIKYLGTKGIVKTIMGEMKNVPNDRKKEFGQVLNELKLFVENRYDELKNAAAGGTVLIPDIDLSLPGDAIPIGGRHPITLMKNRISSIFQRLGFAVAE